MARDLRPNKDHLNRIRPEASAEQVHRMQTDTAIAGTAVQQAADTAADSPAGIPADRAADTAVYIAAEHIAVVCICCW